VAAAVTASAVVPAVLSIVIDSPSFRGSGCVSGPLSNSGDPPFS
jgi:hypothetical protein